MKELYIVKKNTSNFAEVILFGIDLGITSAFQNETIPQSSCRCSQACFESVQRCTLANVFFPNPIRASDSGAKQFVPRFCISMFFWFLYVCLR